MSGLWWRVHDFILEANSHRSILSSQRHVTTQTFFSENSTFFVRGRKAKSLWVEVKTSCLVAASTSYELRSSRNRIRAMCTHESWVNRAYTILNNRKSTWLIAFQRKAILAGRSTGLKSPGGRGVSSVCVGYEKGFMPKVELVYLCQKNISDVQDEISGDCYEKYFVEKLLANVCLNL
jgi:hypothetical protein